MTTSQPVTMVVAAARNGVIGDHGRIPWRLPADQARFKQVTMGGTLVMGRKTFDSIGRPLPGRRTIVVTRDPSWEAEGVSVTHDVPAALALAQSFGQPVFVVGGGEIYRAAMDLVDVIDLTRVDATPSGDVTFAVPSGWHLVSQEDYDGFTVLRYARDPVFSVAVVGAGPAALYLTDALLKLDVPVQVDLYDRMPTPFGLLRYGVAPDHLKMKSLQKTLERVVHDRHTRFVGGVEVGRDVSVEQLREHYHAVVYAFGAASDRHLTIPGEELDGSHSATEFVKWYSAHPDVPPSRFNLREKAAVVVGLGNVAVDVARVLLKDVSVLSRTDIPQQVLDVLADSQIQDVHILGRRGPVQAKFTPKELAELGTLDGVDVFVASQDLALDPASEAQLADAPKTVATNLKVLREWADRVPTGAPRRLFLHFWTHPTRLLGDASVEKVVVQRSRHGATPEGQLTLTNAGPPSTLRADFVLRSVGYLGEEVAGVPYDPAAGTVPSDDGRVLRDAAVSPGEYVVGWARRGPTGVLGTNRHDANDVVTLIAQDRAALLDRAVTPDDLVVSLRACGVPVVDVSGWDLIDQAEQELGRAHDRDRTKLGSLQELLDAAQV